MVLAAVVVLHVPYPIIATLVVIVEVVPGRAHAGVAWAGAISC